MLGKIAGFLLLRKTLSVSTSLIESLLVGMAFVFMLSLVASILFTSLIAGGIYVAYQGMITHGVEPLAAACILGGIIVLVLAVIIMAAVLLAYKISHIPKQLTLVESGISRHINDVVDAFSEGFNAVPAKR